MWFRLGISGCQLNQSFRQSPKLRVHRFFFWITIETENAGKDADHISVQNRTGLVEGDAADGAGGVTPDARQFQDIFEYTGEVTAVALDDLARRPLHIAHACVIPKAFPQFM